MKAPKAGPSASPPAPTALTRIGWQPSRAHRLRELSIKAYWAASNPLEAKMASILLTLFAPDVEREVHAPQPEAC